MTTTSHFQIKPDFSPSEESCLEDEKKISNTNKRYKFFCQTHFTAGDEEQFNFYRDQVGSVNLEPINLENNIFKNIDNPYIYWGKWQNLSPLSVSNTFNYIFYKFKKGMFLKIKDKNLKVFLPFSNKNFINEWSDYIHINPKYRDICKFFENIQKMEGRRFTNGMVNKFTESWYANNCLFRWEFPIHEGDTNISIYSDMFKTLANERTIPNIEFFVNRRDFPIIKKDETEPYEQIYGQGKKLVSHNYKTYAPILSMVGCDNFADIPIPTGDDWARVSRPEGKFFPKTATRQYKLKKEIKWENKKPIAVFRGSSTGIGTKIETNMRLKIAYLSSLNEKDTDGNPFLDAGITEWNLRPRKIEDEKYLQTIDIGSVPFTLVNTLNLEEQAEFKYIIDIDGHVCAFRLSTELENGFCVLLVESKYKLWFTHMLKPFVHYVPVKSDLSDIIEKIKWCKDNDDKCFKIAENAKIFAKKYLSKEGILDYLQKLLYDLKKINNDYCYLNKPLREIFTEKQKEIIQKDLEKTDINISKKLKTISPVINYDYGCLKGVETICNILYRKDILNSFIKLEKQIFKSISTEVYKMDFLGVKICKKTSTHNLINEAFLGLKVLNYLSKHIPNFCYIYGFFDNYLLTEFIEGISLSEWIDKHFDFKNFLSILIQISLSIYMAQKNSKFLHWDLVPWNIIITTLKEPLEIDYIINESEVYTLKTNLIAKIIDFEKSHIVNENIHWGGVSLFKFSTIQDIITLLMMSVNEICKKKWCRDIVKNVITLSNFIGQTKYCETKFSENGSDGLGTVRYFFSKAKKYSTIVSSPKYELENKTPLDFVCYILNNFDCDNIQINKKIQNFFYLTDENLFVNLSFANTKHEKALSYARYFHNLEKNLKLPKDICERYYFCQETWNKLLFIGDKLEIFLKENNISDFKKFIKKFEKTKLIINKIFEISLNEKIEKKEDKDIEKIVYSEELFYFKNKISDILNKHKTYNIEDSFRKDIYEFILLNKNSPWVCKQLLNIKQNNLNAVDLNTIRFINDKI